MTWRTINRAVTCSRLRREANAVKPTSATCASEAHRSSIAARRSGAPGGIGTTHPDRASSSMILTNVNEACPSVPLTQAWIYAWRASNASQAVP